MAAKVTKDTNPSAPKKPGSKQRPGARQRTKRHPKKPALRTTKARAGKKPQDDIPDALKHFDSLPDSAHVRQPVVEGLYGCSASTLWRGVKAGRIPPPSKLSPGMNSWNVGILRRAMANA